MRNDYVSEEGLLEILLAAGRSLSEAPPPPAEGTETIYWKHVGETELDYDIAFAGITDRLRAKPWEISSFYDLRT